jgi:hypothetical protein
VEGCRSTVCQLFAVEARYLLAYGSIDNELERATYEALGDADPRSPNELRALPGVVISTQGGLAISHGRPEYWL